MAETNRTGAYSLYSIPISPSMKPRYSTNSSDYSSGWDSVLSDPSSVQSDYATVFDKPCIPVDFIESPPRIPISILSMQGLPLYDISQLENGWPSIFNEPTHSASILVQAKQVASLGTVPRAPRTFKCWVETCSYFREGFATSKQRKTHYEKVHPGLILRCRVGGCRFKSFLREQDRSKHETRMHSEQEVENSPIRTETLEVEADVTEIAKMGPILVEDIPQDGSAGDRPPTKAIVGIFVTPMYSNALSHQDSGSPAQSLPEASGLLSPPSRTPSFGKKRVPLPNLPLLNIEVQANDNSPGTVDSQRSSLACSDGSTGFDTDSTWSREESDWEDDDIDPNELLAQTMEESEISIRPLLTPMKRELVDGIMKEFWIIFNHEWSANIRKCSGGSPESTSSSVTKGKDKTGNASSSRAQKRQRDGDEGEDDFSGDGERDPKRPKMASPPDSSREKRSFACPYRRHDPRTYCHRTRRWRSCALTPLDTIARVKGHLYRYHRIFQCPRCKVLQKDEAELKAHGLEVKGCEVKDGQSVEGITSEIERQLKSRKKAHRDQSEVERWQEVYRILFPKEEIPSPHFEAIQDDIRRSPESEELTGYEEYSRRELPRFFRHALEAAIADEVQPIEERLRSQLVGMIQDCQDRVFSAYRSRRSVDSPLSNRVTARSPLGLPQISSLVEQATPNIIEGSNTGIVETLYKRVPPQADFSSHPETNLARATWTENTFSDSGYASIPSLQSSNSFDIDSIAASQSIAVSNSQEQQSQKSRPPIAENRTEISPCLLLSLEKTKMQACELQNIPAPELAMDQAFGTAIEDFDFEKWIPSSTGESALQDDQWGQWDNNFQ